MDNEHFVKAIKDTGKKQVIVCGVVTEVCVAFPVLSLIEQGSDVFVITDASGTFNSMTQLAAWNRMSQAGALVCFHKLLSHFIFCDYVSHIFLCIGIIRMSIVYHYIVDS